SAKDRLFSTEKAVKIQGTCAEEAAQDALAAAVKHLPTWALETKSVRIKAFTPTENSFSNGNITDLRVFNVTVVTGEGRQNDIVANVATIAGKNSSGKCEVVSTVKNVGIYE
ncbi:MAG TPA: hypothetical protein VFV50_09190, partial [Bdellovibrionales bacterium]|nr:hypothetical protein [Bdellovibrionales bacterium]